MPATDAHPVIIAFGGSLAPDGGGIMERDVFVSCERWKWRPERGFLADDVSNDAAEERRIGHDLQAHVRFDREPSPGLET